MAVQFKNPKEYIAELIGTAVLISIGCTVGAYMNGGFLTGLGFALTFVGLVYCIGNVCSCHFNPLITLGMFINGRMDAEDTIFYIIAQFIGGLLGALMTFFIMTQAGYSGNVFIFPSVFGDGYVDLWWRPINFFGAFVVEFLFALTLTYVAVKATDSKKIGMIPAMIIGVAMFGLIMIGYDMTWSAVNPAKSLGTAFVMLFSGVEDHIDPLIQLWMFIIAPALGCLAGAFAYLAFGSGKFDVEAFIAEKKASMDAKKAAKAEAAAAAEEAKAAEEAAAEESVEESAEETPAEEEAAEEPSEDIPAEEAVGDAPVEETAEETPVEEVAKEAPAAEPEWKEAPSQAAPAEEPVWKEAPSDNKEE